MIDLGVVFDVAFDVDVGFVCLADDADGVDVDLLADVDDRVCDVDVVLVDVNDVASDVDVGVYVDVVGIELHDV